MAAFAALTFNIEVRAGLARLLDPPNVLSSCPDLARFSRRSSGTKLCADAAKLRLQTCGADTFETGRVPRLCLSGHAHGDAPNHTRIWYRAGGSWPAGTAVQ